jgi:cysteinyl-tRNA synthetase
MSMKYLGESFDIHAGGIDHIPVHHTNEIAQSEAATGHKWVNYWLHNEFLVLSNGKMSKSKGGFLTLQTLIDSGYDALDYRYFLLGGHYRSQLQFSYEALDSAKASRKALADRILALKSRLGDKALPALAELPEAAASRLEAFRGHLADDLSTPRALAELWGLLRDTALEPGAALAAAYDMDRVLGLRLAEVAAAPVAAADPELASWAEGLIAERAAAKKAKDWARADAIRAEFKAKGLVLEDSASGTTWKRA